MTSSPPVQNSVLACLLRAKRLKIRTQSYPRGLHPHKLFPSRLTLAECCYDPQACVISTQEVVAGTVVTGWTTGPWPNTGTGTTVPDGPHVPQSTA